MSTYRDVLTARYAVSISSLVHRLFEDHTSSSASYSRTSLTYGFPSV